MVPNSYKTCTAPFSCGSHRLGLHLYLLCCCWNHFWTTDVYELGFSNLSISVFTLNGFWVNLIRHFANCSIYACVKTRHKNVCVVKYNTISCQKKLFCFYSRIHLLLSSFGIFGGTFNVLNLNLCSEMSSQWVETMSSDPWFCP